MRRLFRRLAAPRSRRHTSGDPSGAKIRELEARAAARDQELAELRATVARLESQLVVLTRYETERGRRADLAAELDALDGSVGHVAHRLDRLDASRDPVGPMGPGGNGHRANGGNGPPPTATRRLTFVTSISPIDLDRQERAIRTWLPYGDVVSINGDGEGSGIRSRLARRPRSPLADVTFATVSRTAAPEVGKPCVHLDALLDHVVAEGSADRVFVVVNSDVHLRLDGLVADRAVSDEVVDLLADGPIFGSRVEVDGDLDPVATSATRADGTYVWGFDYFVLTGEQAARVECSGFVFGQPWWDYYLPTELHRHHRRLHYLENHVAQHVEHAARWSNATFELFARRYADYRAGGAADHLPDPQEVCREIRRNATRIRLPVGDRQVEGNASTPTPRPSPGVSRARGRRIP